MRRVRTERAFTLIELMVVIGLVGLLTGAMISGIGALTNAKLKGATTMVAAAIRDAYARSSATAKPTRIVFDLDKSTMWIEEGSGPMLVMNNDTTQTGGADPATEAEKKAAEQADRILKGPRAPKASFTPIKQETDGSSAGKSLGNKIYFRSIHVAHQQEPVSKGRAYLYVWPGGFTEVAYLQLAKGEPLEVTDNDTMTLFVHPLTGHVKVVRGAKTIKIPVGGEVTEEREDRGSP